MTTSGASVINLELVKRTVLLTMVSQSLNHGPILSPHLSQLQSRNLSQIPRLTFGRPGLTFRKFARTLTTLSRAILAPFTRSIANLASLRAN